MMYCQCDNCRKVEEAISDQRGNWTKPAKWFEKNHTSITIAHSVTQCCSIECVRELIAKSDVKTNKSDKDAI